MKIRSGDTVEVIVGNDKGARGEVQRVVHDKATKRRPDQYRVVVAGINLIKKHQRRTGDVRTQVGIIEREAPLHASNVMVVCPNCNKASRIGFQTNPDGTKSRVCKRCGGTLSN